MNKQQKATKSAVREEERKCNRHLVTVRTDSLGPRNNIVHIKMMKKIQAKTEI